MQQPIRSNKSSHGQPTCKNEIALAYELNLFVRVAFGDSLKHDRKPADHVDLCHMLIIQVLQHPSYQVPY